MFEILNKYFFQRGCIAVPGLGSLHLESIPAGVDASTRQALPQVYHIRFDKFADAPEKEFFAWLAGQENRPDYEAMVRYNGFAQTLRERLLHETAVDWDGLGQFSRDDEGNIRFESRLETPEFLQPVPAGKILRQDAEHTLLVGDRQRTSSEMTELFQEETIAGPRWWLWPAIVGAAALVLIVVHFSLHGWALDAIGNQSPLRLLK